MTVRTRLALGLFSLGACPVWAGAPGPPVPRGPEFQVTAVPNSAPSVAVDRQGRFLVVWSRDGSDGDGRGVVGRVFDASATPQGPEFQVNTATTGDQFPPQAALSGGDGFLVAWGSGVSGSGIFAQRLGASGAPVGSEFRVDTATGRETFGPSLADDGIGNVVMVWMARDEGDANWRVFGRRYDASGMAQGDEFPTAAATANQFTAVVGRGAGGEFVVSWQESDGDWAGIAGRRFDAAGAPAGEAFLMNTYTTGEQQIPGVAVARDGSFVVTWRENYFAERPAQLSLRRFDEAGTAHGPEVLVNAAEASHESVPAVATVGDGFMVVWTDRGDGSSYGISGRGYDAAGNAQGPAFRVNTYTAGLQGAATVAAGPAGDAVVLWTHAATGALLGQRFAPDVIFSDGFEGGRLSAWSTTATDGGDLRATRSAALDATVFGLQATVDDGAGLFVQDDTPRDEGHYRARFYFDPNGFDPGEAQGRLRARVFIAFTEAPLRRTAVLVLRRQDGAYSLMGRTRLDDGTRADTGFFPITDDAHWVELDWRRASASGASDGRFDLWIDGAPVSTLAGLDNDAAGVDLARLGALGVKPGAAGTMYWDEFESRRSTEIGP
jgi:hypothetical protein